MRRMLSRVPDRRRPAGSSGRRARSASRRESAAALSEYEMPARSWTTPSWRSAAIRRRSSADASTARTRSALAVVLAPAQAPGQPPGEGHLHEPEEHEAGEQQRREREPDPAARRRDRRSPAGTSRTAAASRPARGSGGRPRTGCPGRARSGSRACRGRCSSARVAPVREQPRASTSSSGISRADQPRLVGVDDAPVGGPDLDADDALAEHALLDDPVERRGAPPGRRRSTPSSSAGSTMPWPASTANCRASRSASLAADARGRRGASRRRTARARARPVSANCATARATEGASAAAALDGCAWLRPAIVLAVHGLARVSRCSVSGHEAYDQCPIVAWTRSSTGFAREHHESRGVEDDEVERWDRRGSDRARGCARCRTGGDREGR